MDSKICGRCKQDLSISMFYKSKTSKDGFQYHCKQCCKEVSKLWVQNNRESTRKSANNYYKNHPEERKKYAKEWYENNKEKAIENVINRYKNKKDEIEEYKKHWRKENKDKVSMYGKKYRTTHSEQNKLRHKIYSVNNRDKLKVKAHRRNAKIRSLLSTLTIEQWEQCKEHFDYKCAYCGKKVEKLTIDHFIPVCKNGELTINNVIPCCLDCNVSKNSTDFVTWYRKQKFYSKKRKKKVLKYLNYNDSNTQQIALIK